MFKNTTRKAIALGGISLAAAGIIGIGVEVTKAVTSEIQKARAATTAALAEIEKAKAQMQSAIADRVKAEAETLRAKNELLAAYAARDGAMFAAKFMADGARDAAKENSRGLVKATEVDKYVENNIYDGWTSRFLAPAKTIDGYNKEIAALNREAQSGVDLKTRKPLTEDERADRKAQVRILEEDKQIEGEASAANIKEMVGVMMQGFNGLLAQFADGQPRSAGRTIQ